MCCDGWDIGPNSGGDEREQFEAAMGESVYFSPEGFEHDSGVWVYSDYTTDIAWMAWSRRAALAPAAVVMPEALRLVEMLGLVAEKAFHLADGTQEDCTGKTPVFTVDGDDFQALSDALDKCDEEPEIGDAYVRDGWLKVLDRLRAMITPALMVMPERRTDANYPTQLWREAAGWNAALDEVALLNRRAIPVELLERIVTPGNWGGDVEFWNAVEELRALLGKEDVL